MSIRLDPRRLAALKLLAAESGLRPGELVTQWVRERLDTARAGGDVAPAAAPAVDGTAFAALEARVEELARRVEELAARAEGAAPAARAAAEAAAPAEAPLRRARPRKQATAAAEPAAATSTTRARKAARAEAVVDGAGRRIRLHEEIIDIIRERGPMSAAELADAIRERGRYAPPRSAKPLDAASVNARVSNPVYRSRFVRSDGKIGLADQG
ncbi:MAG TPA: hypothetical protein VFH63_10825 [candidate division Zixibacteria bacterium]|nr:hypothetical protein [candidate division Zixibacteria bacterium]